MCSRPVGRIPLKTRLFFPSAPVVNLFTSERIVRGESQSLFRKKDTGLRPATTSDSAGLKPGLCIATSFTKQLARTDHPLHFARPLIDRNHPRSPLHSLPIRLHRRPSPAIHLHRLSH